jgi:hypothetical protein
MDKSAGAFGTVYNFIHNGFNDVRLNILAVVIAIIVAFALMKKWGQLIPMLVLATVAHLIIVAFVVPLVDKKTPVMPDILGGAFWMTTASLAVGYGIMLIVLFFLKKNVFKMGGGGH